MSYFFRVFCSRKMMCQIQWIFRVYLCDRIVELCEVAVETNNTLFWGASFGLNFPLLKNSRNTRTGWASNLVYPDAYLLVKWNASLLQLNMCNLFHHWFCFFTVSLIGNGTFTPYCVGFFLLRWEGDLFLSLPSIVFSDQNLLCHMVLCSIKWKHESFG